MKAAIRAMLLFIVSTGCACASRNLTECRDSCIAKITDTRLCNETCVQLSNTSSDSNITAPPPVPDPPLLLSSTYFTFTLQWNDYPQTKYNASPVVYVLEVTRHENISDPAIILPFLTKYHATTNTTYTIPQEFVTKTNFSFRLAVVAAQGSSEFSPSSPLYVTNDTCDRALHSGHFGTPAGTPYPCPIFNLRINFTATEVLFKSPRISTTLYWDYPHDIHTNLEFRRLNVKVTLSDEFPYTREQACVRYGVQVHNDDLSPQHPRTSESYPLLSGQTKTMYFGCPYVLKLYSVFEMQTKDKFVAETTFYIPHCIHGFCGCEGDNSLGPTTDSHHIDVDVRQSNHSMNRTTANVTWRNEAWRNKIPEFFKLVILECPNGNCPSLLGHKREILLADPTKTFHSYILPNLTEGEQYFVVIGAFDKSGCVLSPTEGQKFKASVPLPTTSKPSTPAPTAKPNTEPSTPQPSAQVPSATTPGNGKTTGVTLTAKEGMSSATVAAITVPIVLLLVFVLVLVVMCWFRLKRKPRRLHRAPTGLQRLAEHMQNGDRENCLRNRQNNLSSPYSSDYDRSELRVNLPSKSDGGLELNPAYVEQRIQEAMETGDADVFEFGYHRLELKRILGKGAFGKVFLAEAYGIGGSQETSLVAVKVLNEKANEDEKEDFKMEINFMKTLGRHENVVTMIGCCTLYPPLCLIVEYVPHGDLLHYLRNLRKTFEMQNRKLQAEDIEKLKNEAKGASSEAKITSDESVMGPGGYSRRPLVPSASETALSELSHDADQKPLKAKKRRLLRQCKSEGKQLCIGSAFKKYEKFFEPEELAKIKRTNSATSFMGLSASNLFTPRRASDSPQAHYVTRVPPITTDVSNNTETTLVSDTKSKSQPSSPSRTMGVDGALDASDLQSFALQIANGMAYLANRGIIHRDLAARNILVGDEKVLKISDFGLSREGIYVKRSTGKIPLRWLSIEAMRDRIYSTASDVWAFGIVLWEICTLGGFPYPTMNDRDLLEFLLEGNRMDKPDNCTDEIYQIMLACWARDCEDRPSFQSLSEHLFDMEKQEHPYVNVDPSQDFILPPTAGRDTVGNLINFSDGTFSGTSDDRESSESAIHYNQLIAGKMWPQGDGPPLSDAENAGYESSGASSEDLSEPEAKISGNDIVVFSQSTGATNDTENYLNSESPV